MRWLVMFPKVELGSLKALRTNFGLVASAPQEALAWVTGALANQLEESATGVLREGVPFVLMTLRGRAYLRMRLEEPVPAALGEALALFETAVTQAMRAVGGHTKSGAAWPSASTTAWQSLDADAIAAAKAKPGRD